VLLILGLLLSYLIAVFASGIFEIIFYQNILFVPAIVSEMLTVFIVWFCHSFSYKIQKHWKAILFFQLIAILNFYLLYVKIEDLPTDKFTEPD